MGTKVVSTKLQDLVELYSESFNDERGLCGIAMQPSYPIV